MPKVKGHARNIDVQRGYVLACDKFGNDGADKFACTGADQHAVPEELLQLVGFQQLRAVRVQTMMVEILCARRIHLNRHAGDQDDDALEAEHELLEMDADEALVVQGTPVGAVT